MQHLKALHLWFVGAMTIAIFGDVGARAVSADDAAPADEATVTQNSNTDSELLVAEGELLYTRRCGACHSLDTNRIGPRHRSVCGRVAGSLDDYNYSLALTQSGLVWNAAALDVWLQNPEAAIPGQRMGFRLASQEEREAIIAYLCTLSQNQPS